MVKTTVDTSEDRRTVTVTIEVEGAGEPLSLGEVIAGLESAADLLIADVKEMIDAKTSH